jgi:ribosome biogenesis GTPase
LTSITSLHDLGWLTMASAIPVETIPPNARPARVMWQGRGAWRVHDGTDEVLARPRRRSLSAAPVTGDWVTLVDDLGAAGIDEVLPRRTVLARGEAGGRSEAQVIAANVDVVGVCAPADAANPRRIERELTAVWSSGAMPVVLVTKADLADDVDDVVARLAGECLGVDVIALSSRTGVGLDRLAAHLGRGRTVALIGPSGVGKSSLVNALAGAEVIATAAIRADGKGRHTTTSRHLVPLPGGGLLLDTPGMREFAPWADDEGLAQTFGDIEDLAGSCRFADCAHEHEPECAVRAAAEADEAVARRLAAWQALQRELAWRERRHDARLQREERRKWAAISKSMRGSGTIRP